MNIDRMVQEALIRWMQTHKPEQTLIVLDYGEPNTVCYLINALYHNGKVLWQYESIDGITILIPEKNQPQIL